jgi:hypothetical protein
MLGFPMQRKLTVSAPNDIHEQEADQMADRVTNLPESDEAIHEKAPMAGTQTGVPLALQRQEASDTDEQGADPTIHQGGKDGDITVEPGVEETIQGARGKGNPMPDNVRASMDQNFGADFSGVNIHTGAEADMLNRSLNARAFTVGQDIFFKQGEYAPDNSAGRKLLAHELTHVVQQDAAPLQRSPSSSSQRARPDAIQRVIAIGGSDLDAAGIRNTQTEIVTTHLADIVNNTQRDLLFTRTYRANLIRDTVLDMHQTSGRFNYASVEQLARDVRQRVLASLYMRQSQGSTRWRMAFSYPDRPSDGTAGVGPRVNQAATGYWGPVQDPGGSYFFEMNDAGRADPYQAIIKLFTEQTNPHRRTLIHCDYVVSVIQYRSWIESIGVARFNEGVRRGLIPAPVLKWNGFEDLERPTTIPGAGAAPDVTETPLQSVRVASEDDLIIGDHVVFYNHESYDALIEGVGGIWRLENAIVIDRRGGENRYQGHGYFSPVPKRVLLAGMIRQYNIHINRARQLTQAVERARTPAREAAARTRLREQYPNVREKVGGGWEISGMGLCDRLVTRDLRNLTASESPGLIYPCTGEIWVSRPVHTTP